MQTAGIEKLQQLLNLITVQLTEICSKILVVLVCSK